MKLFTLLSGKAIRSAQILLASLIFLILSCKKTDKKFSLLEVADGYKAEKVVGGLTYPTSLTWDNQGNMYVAEAGGGLPPEQLAPSRIMKVANGTATEFINLTGKGVHVALVGMVWFNGAFYITHRADDRSGAVSRVTMNGQVTKIFDGILDSKAEHQINDIKVGPDGKLYVAVGPAGNSGVIDMSIAPSVKLSPDVHTTPCKDIVLLGRNFKSADFRSSSPTDSVMTGAYVPFGTATSVGQKIPGAKKCGGSILKFDPNNAEATITMHAWGFRNLIGIGWDKNGKMYATENGYDIRGSRPVKDEYDASLRINEGMWYGVPDFSAGREPLTNAKFEVPDAFQAEVFVGNTSLGKNLGFVINHAASGLTPPTPAVVLSRHEVNSSPVLFDIAPDSWGPLAGQLFIAEWGDLAPPTNPLRGNAPAEGFRVVKVNPNTGDLTPFVFNKGGGIPASEQGKTGQGLDRPFDVKFGPDGAMYIVDYGVVNIDMSKTPPYDSKAGTGAIWKVTETKKTKK